MGDLPAYPEAAAKREEAQGPPEEHVRYASWGRPAAAYLLDALIVVAIIFAVAVVGFGVAAVDETAGGVLVLITVVALIGFPFFYYIDFVGKTGQIWRADGTASACNTSGQAIPSATAPRPAAT
jgi:hypothetical protein